MFECPTCGFKDSACWRTSRFVIYAVYCTLDELEVFEPEVAAKLKEEKRIVLGPYVYYKRGRANHIYRIHKELEAFTKSNKTEKPKDPFERKLTEFSVPKGVLQQGEVKPNEEP